MKFGLASDLHLDFGDINEEFFNWRGDVLLLAGDLAEEDFLRKHGHAFLDRACKMAVHVFIIAGNHEYYRSEIDTADEHLEIFFSDWSEITFLRNRSVSLGGVSIFGATMWTDFHGSPVAEVNASVNLNDYRHIRYKAKAYRKINPRDILVEHQKGYNALLDYLEKDDKEKKIVMTHHAPSMWSVPRRYKHDYELNKAYCNHFESLIEAHPEIVAWPHGHTHDYFDYTIGKTRVMCNPRGYPAERPRDLPPYQPLTFTV